METIEFLKNRCEEQQREIDRLKRIFDRVKGILSNENDRSSELAFDVSYNLPSIPDKFAPNDTSTARESQLYGPSLGVKRWLDFEFPISKQKLKQDGENVPEESESSETRVKKWLADISQNPPSTSDEILICPATTHSTSPILGSSTRRNRRAIKIRQTKPAASCHSQDSDATYWEGAEENLSMGMKQNKENFGQSLECDKSPGVKNNYNNAENKIMDTVKEAAACSYDRVPSSPKLAYAYQSGTVRGSKRKQLPGQTCNNCEEYYEAAGVPYVKCSKHRSNYPRTRTPPGFWGLTFPSTQELRERQAATPSP